MSFKTALNAPPTKSAPKGASKATISLLRKAFTDRTDLLQRLQVLASKDETLVNDLSQYVLHLKQAQNAPLTTDVVTSQSKKRKFEDSTNGSTNGWASQSVKPDYAAPDTSFSIPQRKKLRLEWIGSDGSDLAKGGIRAADAEGNVEFGISWKDLDQIFCLPVPEKTKRQHNFVAIPYNAHGIVPVAPGAPEPIIWTAFEPGAKDVDAPKEPQHTAALLRKELRPFGKNVTFPDEEEFASAIVQSHRKGEAAFHVKGFRGSKDGFLYFLAPGILWAFKKPLLFLPFSSITSISYTSVLQRTFNLNIAVSSTAPDGTLKEEEIEFSMLDQADFAGIDEYVKRHGLNDASLAAGRRAKKYGVNEPKVKEVEGEGGANGANGDHEMDEGQDGETELQKAERLLQDQEDEEEEDYVDEGSGVESGSEESEDEGGYAEVGDGEVEGEVFEEEEEFEDDEGGYEDEGK
ncbi:Rtt106-domain-containing protein [Tothia fuscella]|uniref:Rtt106-domain-containing protein n=1 Tax=Tothia fuscella TaxID=1048955 RepID=A0A9P4NES0_9PEZI|nr:Rtt106-domain-containing protein [Tothia fuscella]